VVTARTYWNLAEAGLAKTLLDNYEIPCALLDENASSYITGQQFAVPIRLVVDENEVDRAICILNNDFEKAAEIEGAEEGEEVERPLSPEKVNRNPWELLMLAFYLFVPAIFVLQTKYSDVVATNSWTKYVVARARVTHLLSWLAILVAIGLVALYFRVRRSSMHPDTLANKNGA
jgi:hypothetical protein